VTTVDGDRGELTVLVNGMTVARRGDSMPDMATVLGAIRGTASVTT